MQACHIDFTKTDLSFGVEVILNRISDDHDFLLGCFEKKYHQENMSVKCIHPYTPLLYSKTGVYRSIYIFVIFAPKHRLWVLIRTASPRQF